MARKKKTVTPEEINKETAKAVTEEVTEEVKDAEGGSPGTSTPTVEEITEVVKDEPTPEVTEEVKESAKPEIAEDVESEVIEEVAEAVDESVDPEATEMVEEAKTEDEGDEVTAEETEVSEEAADEETGVVEETTEVVDEVTEEESSLPEPEPEFMNIEHFADYRKIEETIETEPADDVDGDESVEDNGSVIDEEAATEDEIDEYREYENLTILDEIDEEPSEPPVQAKVHKESKDAQPYDAQKPRKVDVRFDFIELFVCMLVAIMLLSAFVFRHSVVDGGSMEETLYDSEHLIITNFFYTPKQYDIVVCEDYTTGLQKPIIKRIIATEGQTVRVVSMKEVYVDGELVDTSFVHIDGTEDFPYSEVYPVECVVPEGEVFVMGDHRNSSLDSRMFGTVDEDSILGKVILRFYPFDRFGKVE